MDRDALLRPRGPEPAAVYWYRRAVVVAVVLALVVLIAVGVRSVGGPDRVASIGPASPTTTPTAIATTPVPTTTPTPSATTPSSTTPARSATTSTRARPSATAVPRSTTPSTSASCTSGSPQLVVTVSEQIVAAGSHVGFTATLTPSGGACTVAGGPTFVVSSGSDRIWSNTDCAALGNATESAATSGLQVGSNWDLQRSAPGCERVNGTTTAQPGTYRVQAAWAGASSQQQVFTIQ